MDSQALVLTLLFCIFFVLFEAFGASKAGKTWFEKLKQPKFSFPFWVWYIIGGLYYIICGVITYRLLSRPSEPGFVVSFVLLCFMMFINGFTNYILFKLRSLKMFYFAIYPFSAITITLFVILLYVDTVAAWVLFPYVLWLIYDVYYFHFIWKLNRQEIRS